MLVLQPIIRIIIPWSGVQITPESPLLNKVFNSFEGIYESYIPTSSVEAPFFQHIVPLFIVTYTHFSENSQELEMNKNTICLWYNHDAEEAAHFYAKTFPDSKVDVVHRHHLTFQAVRQVTH
jgi:hypothetical protein